MTRGRREAAAARKEAATAAAEKRAEEKRRARAAVVVSEPMAITTKLVNRTIYEELCGAKRLAPVCLHMFDNLCGLVDIRDLDAVHDAVADLKPLFDKHLRGDVGTLCDADFKTQVREMRKGTTTMLMSVFELLSRPVWVISEFPRGVQALVGAYCVITY